MWNSVYVSRIPKGQCTKSYLYRLFLSVAQVRNVWLDSEKGEAKITLYDSSSMDLVLKRKWTINNSTLKLSRHPIPRAEAETKCLKTKNNADVKVVKRRKCPYLEYRKQATQFLDNIPHEKSQVARQRKRRRKYTQKIWEKRFDSDIQTEKERNFMKRKLQMKCNNPNTAFSISNKKKRRTQDLLRVSFCVNQLSSCTTIRKNKSRKNTPSTANLVNERNFQSNQCSTKVEKMQNMHRSLQDSSLVPVYVERCGKNKLFHVNSVSNLRKGIEKEIGIPIELQFLLYKGTMCQQETHTSFQPYDTIRLIVRGKGGMKTDAVSVSSSSPDEDVYNWLLNDVGIDKEIISSNEAFLILDGKHLFKFSAEKLSEELNIPIGIARKIILRRDRTEQQTPDLRTPEDVANFVRSLNKKNANTLEKISEEIIKLHIDGEVFMNYTADTLRMDMEHLQINKFFFTFIINARNEQKHEGESKNYSNGKSENATQSAQFAVQQESMEGKIQPLVEFSDFLCEKLSLDRISVAKHQEESDMTNCSLRILYGGWSDSTETENLFLFHLLCAKEEVSVQSAIGGLWKIVRLSIPIWIEELPTIDRPKQKKPDFQKKGNCCRIMEKDLPSVLTRKHHFLLTSKSIMTHSNDVFCANIGNLPQDILCFKLKSHGHRIFVFNPHNFKDGFQTVDNAADMCGLPVNPSRMYDSAEEDKMKTYDSKSDMQPSLFVEDEIPRPFRGESQHIYYTEGSVLPFPESGGNLLDRCCEFKSFEIAVECSFDKQISKFLKETLRFACACLNSRKNGTIYFGVVDKPHGQIRGVDLDSDCKSKYTDFLQKGIKKCFEMKAIDAATSCIGDPVFVRVRSTETKKKKYVIEVDVEPCSDLCHNHVFGINLHNIGVLHKEEENKMKYFERDGSSSSVLKEGSFAYFIETKLKTFIERRHLDEKRSTKIPEMPFEKPAAKLSRLLAGGNSTFDNSVWRIAVIGKPTDEQKSDPSWMENFAFVSRMNFTVVFDFDDMSEEDGMCMHFRNEATSMFIRESSFERNIANFQNLASNLGIPHNQKTIWLFANGRMSERKKHLSRDEWHTKYSAGISNAVSFFSQPFVIPQGRVRILVFLLSRDFEGILDTFHEITKNFGWNPVVILAENKDLYEEFAKKITEERKGKRDVLDHISVTDIHWSHVLETFNELTGFDEVSNFLIPSSSGSHVRLDEKMISSLADIVILASNQCEHKNFKTQREMETFKYEQEMNFFRGAKVTWWNLFFETHVLKRHIFSAMKDVIGNLLINRKHERNRKVMTVTLAHEPGSGGTTLGRHLLWEFRKTFRCVIVSKITQSTVSNLSSIWKFKEPIVDHIQPILVFLDDLSHAEYTYEEFMRQLNIEFRKEPVVEGLNCCVIACLREDFMQKIQPDRFLFTLKQEVHKTEKEWLSNKHLELESISQSLGHGDLRQSHLISFMIMRNGFNLEFINSIIGKILDPLESDSKEVKLLSYVSLLSYYIPYSRRGTKFFLPIECCDELMSDPDQRVRDGIWWVSSLPQVLKILLIIENKENASGQHIRIAHPKLAKSVLAKIMSLTKSSRSTIARSFLKSSVLNAPTYGLKCLVDFTCEMFVRRKSVENDDEVPTSFSQLIEDIIEYEENGHKIACQILEEVFNLFKSLPIAYAISQTLGRLWSKMKDFDNALKWAATAVDLAPSIKRLYCLHTLGFILREKFKEQTKNKLFSPEDAKEYIKLLLDSLHNFVKSQESPAENFDINLCSYHDTIITVNTIAKFIMSQVVYASAKASDIRNYLLYINEIPHEISDAWGDFHSHLKGINEIGINAFQVLEQDICFHTAFVAKEISDKFKESRTYRLFSFKYPHLFRTFSDIFGIKEDEEKAFKSTDMQDTWHRGKVLSLQGNSFINIFNFIMKMKKKRYQYTKASVEKQFLEIKWHLSQIRNKLPADVMNLVCVNVSLGLIGGKQRDNIEEIIRKCKMVVNLNKGNLGLAYFFIMVLMWPVKEMEFEYDDELFRRALKFLNDRQRLQKKNSKVGFASFRDKRILQKTITQFFLKKGVGMKSVLHRSDIFFKDEGNQTRFWEDHAIADTLQLLEGHHTLMGDTYCIKVENQKGGKDIQINILRSYRDPESTISEEPVTFYLGFSITGPVAYAIESKNKRHNNVSVRMRHPCYEEKHEKLEDFIEMETIDLKKKLDDIKRIKEKLPQYRRERDKQLLRDEEYIKMALEIKEDRDITYNLED